MPQFRPVVLLPSVAKNKHEDLSDSFSWSHMLDGFVAKQREAGADTSHSLSEFAVPVASFHEAALRALVEHVQRGVWVEVRVPESDLPKFERGDVKCYWYAEIIKVAGYRVLCRWLGNEDPCEERLDFWINLASLDVQPTGHAVEERERGVKSVCVAPPRDVHDKRGAIEWLEYMHNKMQNAMTLRPSFVEDRKKLTDCKFAVNQCVELLDLSPTTQVRPARVVKTVGRRVCTQVKSEDFDISSKDDDDDVQYERDYWCDHSSLHIFHVGWANKNGYTLASKPAYAKHAKQVGDALLAGKEPSWKPHDSRPSTIKEWKENKGGSEWKVGYKLEIIDQMDTTFQQLKPATVLEVLKDGYLRIGADGPDQEDECFPVHSSSHLLFPCGYADKWRIKCVPPPDCDEDDFSWAVYLKQCKAKAAPEHLFHQVDEKDMKAKFQVGARLEAIDMAEPRLICAATVAAHHGRLLRIHYDGWEDSYDQLFDYRSSDIFPVGWCEMNGYKLEQPKGFEEPPKKKRK